MNNPRNARQLMNKLESQLISVFASAPEYGSVSFEIQLHEGEPVRIQSGFTESLKLVQREHRGGA